MAANTPAKILILRLSSIGDIVLTTPVIRSLRKCFPEAEIHFLTKSVFHDILKFNPYLDKIHLFDKQKGLDATLSELRQEEFEVILDLHHNLRTLRIGMGLDIPRHTFPKLNTEKFLLTQLKVNRLPDLHIVERYAKTLEPLGCKLDGEGLDFFCGEAAEKSADEILGECNFSSQPVGMVLGGNFATKKWPAEYAAPLLNQLGQAVILFGGPAEAAEAGQIAADLQVPFLNAAGRFDLLTSAALLRKCRLSIANDTGFMHISAAFGLRTVSIWGNTVPEFGMYPYHTEHLILEEKGLACRPCSKLGHATCPKGHFDCMRKITPERVLGEMRRVGWV